MPPDSVRTVADAIASALGYTKPIDGLLGSGYEMQLAYQRAETIANALGLSVTLDVETVRRWGGAVDVACDDLTAKLRTIGWPLLVDAADEIDHLRADRDAFRDALGRVASQLGYDPEAACGPADLCPAADDAVTALCEHKQLRRIVAKLANLGPYEHSGVLRRIAREWTADHPAQIDGSGAVEAEA
jgi:hypothetical protein